jgi:hypothetical protein
VIKAGVPQGSVLGPLLFLIFINDLVKVIDHSMIRMFADDTCLINSNKNIDIASNLINHDLTKVEIWAFKWIVDFSPVKTEAMLISNKKSPKLSVPINFLGTEVIIVDNHKHLGLTISPNLNWETHVDIVIKSCSPLFNILKCLKYKVNRKTLDSIYSSFIRPKLEYGSSVFAGAPNTILNKLDKFEIEILRIITGATRGTSSAKIIIEYGKATLKKRRDLSVLALFYSIHKGQSASYLSKILASFRHTRNYNFRAEATYKNPFCKLSIYSRSFFPNAIKLWNALPLETRSLPTLLSFKRELNPKNYRVPIYYYGERWPGVHHARLRMECSNLNYDLWNRLHVRDDKSCACGWFRENSIHYVCYCPRFVKERNAMIIELNKLGITSQGGVPDHDLLLYGKREINVKLMKSIFQIMHNYISATKRFYT